MSGNYSGEEAVTSRGIATAILFPPTSIFQTNSIDREQLLASI